MKKIISLLMLALVAWLSVSCGAPKNIEYDTASDAMTLEIIPGETAHDESIPDDQYMPQAVAESPSNSHDEGFQQGNEHWSEYDLSILERPVPLAFIEESLISEEFPYFISNFDMKIEYVVDLGAATQVKYRIKSPEAASGEMPLCSYLEVAGKRYDLAGFSESFYDSCDAVRTNIKSPYTVYAYNIILGADYAQRQYFTIENNIPRLIFRIDCAFESDVDDDGWEESVYMHGLYMQTQLYVWDVENGAVYHADINDALGSSSVIYDKEENIFIADYNDATDSNVRELIMIYGPERQALVLRNVSMLSNGDGMLEDSDGLKYWIFDRPVDTVDGYPLYINYQSLVGKRYQNSEVIYVSSPQATGDNVMLFCNADLYDFKIIVIDFVFRDDTICYFYSEDGVIFEIDHVPPGVVVNYENVDIGTFYAEGFSFCDSNGIYYAYGVFHGGRHPGSNIGKIELQTVSP